MNSYEHPSEIFKNDFRCFIAKCFQTINPGVNYLPNWHINVIANMLEQSINGDEKRLIINIPPRYLKSVIVSVAWPAWLLGNNPKSRIIVSCYSQALSIKHSVDCRIIMESTWFQKLFPACVIEKGENQKTKFVTTERGFRFATSVGGTLTGEGGDILIIDDPHNPAHIYSDKVRGGVLEWFDNSFATRLNNKNKGVIVLVMQRLHVDDLSGYLLRKDCGWKLLSIPAVAEKDENYDYKYDGQNYSYNRKAGDLLHEGRENHQQIKNMQKNLGTMAFAAQYQQQPILKEGGMVQLNWFLRYEQAITMDMVVQSWDTAIKTGINNDYSVGMTLGIKKNNIYVLDVIRQRWGFPELRRVVTSYAVKWRPNMVLIEDMASGQSLLQELKYDFAWALKGIRPSGDKVIRLARVTPLIESGKVFLPKMASWLCDFEQEFMQFPTGANDDQIDAFTQGIGWIREKAGMQSRVKRL